MEETEGRVLGRS